MEVPTPESSGSTTSTVAPEVMADWASVSWVVSLPWAFWTVKSEVLSPAVVNARVRYGASNSVYRADETVSGRMTATLPLPSAARPVRPFMAVKVLVKEVVERVLGVLAPLVVVVVVDDELLELQAAASRPPTSSMLTSPRLVFSLKVLLPRLVIAPDPVVRLVIPALFGRYSTMNIL